MKQEKDGIDYSEWKYDKLKLNGGQIRYQSENNYNDDDNNNNENYPKRLGQYRISQRENTGTQYALNAGQSQYYSQKPKGRLKKSEIITAISLLLSGLIITIYLTAMLAQGLNIGHLIGKMNKAEINQKQYYAVQIGNFPSETQAVTAAESIKILGGGGYIVNDGTYRIIAAVYPDENLAVSVMAGITEFSAQQYIINVPKIRLNFDDKAISEAVKKSIALWNDVYQKLYNISLSLDKGEIIQSSAKLQIKTLQDSISEHITAYANLTEGESRLDHIRIKAGMMSLVASLNSLSSPQTEKDLSSQIKYVYTKILTEYRSLANELNN